MHLNKFLVATVFFFTLVGCKNRNQAEVFLLSGNKDSLIIGAYMLTAGDTSGVRLIFDNVADPRISHKTEYYGQSVYQAKVNAMRRISKLDPPQKITSEPNIGIINFYRRWAVESGYLD